jgi:hypothetical protein
VNGNQVKNVKGKKTDVQACLWIHKLHALGLLAGSFMPTVEWQSLTTCYSQGQYLIQQLSKYINKMQKALGLINIGIDGVLNDLMGQSGPLIIEAILAGQPEATQLASLANYPVKKSPAEIAQPLAGNYGEDLLFELGACLSLYHTYQQKLQDCHRLLASKLASLAQPVETPSATPPAAKQPTKHSPTFALRE